MIRYLDPKNDFTFKRIFGEHPDLLKSFLNALMPLKENQQIESLEYLPAEQVPDNPLRKNSIVDVRCRDNAGRHFIVEMQETWTERRMAVRFLKEVEEHQGFVSEDLKENEEISRALDMCEEGACTDAELAACDEYWDAIRIEDGLIAEIVDGEAKGRAESLVDVVLNGKRNGFSTEQIPRITGLSEERIMEILRFNS
jgi:hypothetical protein